MPLDLTDDKWTLVQVMAWCRQATSHYLSQFDQDMLNENCCISIQISPKSNPNGPIDNMPALVQIIAWRWSGDKPIWTNDELLYWQMYVSLALDEITLIFESLPN